MIEDDVKSQVDTHYAASKTEVLLLSKLGEILTKSGLWPPKNDNRTLTEVVEATDGVSLVRDEHAKAFIAIVPAGSEHIATSAIENRNKRNFLRDVSRALLAAFTITIDHGKHVYVQLEPNLKFAIQAQALQGGILVDDDLRAPEIDVSDIRSLDMDDVVRLDKNIREWCKRHDVEHKALTWRHRPSVNSEKTENTQMPNGLERLYAAQDSDVAKRLVIPFDIAIELSRME